MVKSKFFSALIGVLFTLGLAGYALGATVVTNTTDQLLNAVDESTSALNVGAFAEMSIFISGTYEDANKVVLQREAGSPGSGAWRTVATMTTGTANARIETTWVNGPNRNAYRLTMTATGTGDVVAYLTDWPRAAVDYMGTSFISSHNVDFDDFIRQNEEGSLTLMDAEVYIATEDGGDTAGDIAVYTPAVREGAVTILSDTQDDSFTCLSYVTLANFASLVSDGVTIFEARVSFTDDDGHLEVGFNDVLCATNDDNYFDVNAEVITANTSNGSTASWVQGADGTDITFYQALSAIADVEGANALAVPVEAMIPGAYDVLRVEVDAAGNAYFYLNGSLRHAEPLAVTTSAEIAPYIAVSGAGGGAVGVTIDYWMFIKPRPVSPSS